LRAGEGRGYPSRSPGLYNTLGRAFSHPQSRGPSLCALEALRGNVEGATMTTPGGARTLWSMSQLPRARRTGFAHTVGALPTELRPFPRSQPARYKVLRVRLQGQILGIGDATFARRAVSCQPSVADAVSQRRGMQPGRKDSRPHGNGIAGVISWLCPVPMP
jgi:hypothetical protein